MQTPYCTATCPGASLVKPCALLSLTGLSKISGDENEMRRPVGGIHENSPGSPGRVAMLPFCGVCPDRLMIENHRTGLIWKTSMSNREVQPALDAIGFHKD